MEKLEKLNTMYDSIRETGAVKNKKELAALIGVNYSTLSSAFGGDERYLTNSLLAKMAAAVNGLPSDQNTSLSRIPVIPTEARGGSLGDFADAVSTYDCEMLTSPIKGATYAIQVTGDSMSPEFPSGCHILIKRINEEAFVEWGKTYVLDTENGAVIKVIRRTEKPDVVECVSLNPAYQPFEINTRYIKGWYRVLMVMSLK